jgi:SAM-dependent methyltransferase
MRKWAKEDEILKKYLSWYWLRPETAIWRSIDSIQISKLSFEKPSIDVGCGDGSFSFLNFGGKVEENFDVYKMMNDTTKFFKNKDIHDVKSEINFKILKKPKISIDIGIDLKKNLLKKAKKFHFYSKLIPHDFNKKLPFDDSIFTTVFSNTFYWSKNIEQLLHETHRITNDNCKVVLFLPDEKFRKNLIYNKFKKEKHEWARILDRGIYDNVKHCYSFNKWKTIFKYTGFKISSHSTHLSPLFIKMWSIGTRPYSPFMIEMSNSITSKQRNKIKHRMNTELFSLYKSIFHNELNAIGKQNCFHMFVLSK